MEITRRVFSREGEWDNCNNIINKYILKNKNKNELSKQLEQEQNHRNGDHMEGYQWGGDMGRMREKVQGISSINDRYKIDRGRLRIVWEMEKPKNLYV